jgi:hypothetical protein
VDEERERAVLQHDLVGGLVRVENDRRKSLHRVEAKSEDDIRTGVAHLMHFHREQVGAGDDRARREVD